MRSDTIEDVLCRHLLRTHDGHKYVCELVLGYRITGTNLYLQKKFGGVLHVTAEALKEDPQFEQDSWQQIYHAFDNTLKSAMQTTTYPISFLLSEITGRTVLEDFDKEEDDNDQDIGTLTFPVDLVFPIWPDGTLPDGLQLVRYTPILKNKYATEDAILPFQKFRF